MSERITQELRRAMNVEREYAMDGDVVVRMYCMGRDEFANLCDNIDAVHANLERENESLRRELDRVLGELDEVHKTDGLSDNSGGFMHDEKRSIGSAVVTITDELRKWASVEVPYKYGHQLNAIADRIDAEHEAIVSYWQGASYKDGYDDGFASADDWLAQHEDAMAEHGWVRLPKDADGEYIRIGDAVTCGATVWTVTGLKFLGEGWGVCCTVYNEYGGSGTSVYPPSNLRHYHEPTVEDVLREMHAELDEVTALYVGEAIDSDERDHDEARIFAEYAAKLRLAGDAE